jgi:arylsulfatase
MYLNPKAGHWSSRSPIGSMYNIQAMTRILIVVLLAISMVTCQGNVTGVEDRPDILLILVDDMGWSDIGCYGGEVSTPNLDSLAYRGIRFTQFHNTSKCFPSRACLLTGVYAQQCGYDRSFQQPIENAVTLGEVLQTAGYRTLWSGKHHGIENPVTRGFDRYYGLRDGACNHFNPGIQRPGEGLPAQKARPSYRTWCIDDSLASPYTPPMDFYTTDYFTNHALEWLDQHGPDSQPFFLFMAYTAPHDPLMAWPEDIDKYREMYSVGYETIRKARTARQLEMGLIDERFNLSDPSFPAWSSLDPATQESEALKMAVYAAMIDRVDQNIGRILAKLRELGRDQNTLILFMSDNGSSAEVVSIPGEGEIGSLTRWTSLAGDWANVSNTPFRYFKNYSHEGGICTPLIAYWPDGIEGGSTSDFCGHFIDIMPTLAEIAGAEYPCTFKGDSITPAQGLSLLPVFKGEQSHRKSTLYWEWQHGKAIREGRWKIVTFGEDAAWELYDMETDLTETRDLAASHPEIVRDLSGKWESWSDKIQ